MRRDYDIWPYKPEEKPEGKSLYEMITRARINGLTEFTYTENGSEVIVKLSTPSSRTPEMMY